MIGPRPPRATIERALRWVGRWGRATRWLVSEWSRSSDITSCTGHRGSPRRVADVGCAFGFGSARLAATGAWVVGVELDPAYVRQGARNHPSISFVQASATRLPLRDRTVDAVTCLDVLEHVDEAQTEGPSAQATAAAEVARVLRISGVAVVSVPASGPWAWADSLNLYAALRRRSPRWLPLDPSEVASGASHRHFSEATLVGILDSAALAVTRSERTGTGVVPEILHLAILVVTRGILRSELWYQRLRGVYFGAHVLDDTIVIPRLGYSLTVLARRVTSSPSRAGQASHLGPHPPGRP